MLDDLRPCSFCGDWFDGCVVEGITDSSQFGGGRDDFHHDFDAVEKSIA